MKRESKHDVKIAFRVGKYTGEGSVEWITEEITNLIVDWGLINLSHWFFTDMTRYALLGTSDVVNRRPMLLNQSGTVVNGGPFTQDDATYNRLIIFGTGERARIIQYTSPSSVVVDTDQEVESSIGMVCHTDQSTLVAGTLISNVYDPEEGSVSNSRSFDAETGILTITNTRSIVFEELDAATTFKEIAWAPQNNNGASSNIFGRRVVDLEFAKSDAPYVQISIIREAICTTTEHASVPILGYNGTGSSKHFYNMAEYDSRYYSTIGPAGETIPPTLPTLLENVDIHTRGIVCTDSGANDPFSGSLSTVSINGSTGHTAQFISSIADQWSNDSTSMLFIDTNGNVHLLAYNNDHSMIDVLTQASPLGLLDTLPIFTKVIAGSDVTIAHINASDEILTSMNGGAPYTTLGTIAGANTLVNMENGYFIACEIGNGGFYILEQDTQTIPDEIDTVSTLKAITYSNGHIFAIVRDLNGNHDVYKVYAWDTDTHMATLVETGSLLNYGEADETDYTAISVDAVDSSNSFFYVPILGMLYEVDSMGRCINRVSTFTVDNPALIRSLGDMLYVPDHDACYRLVNNGLHRVYQLPAGRDVLYNEGHWFLIDPDIDNGHIVEAVDGAPMNLGITVAAPVTHVAREARVVRAEEPTITPETTITAAHATADYGFAFGQDDEGNFSFQHFDHAAPENNKCIFLTEYYVNSFDWNNPNYYAALKMDRDLSVVVSNEKLILFGWTSYPTSHSYGHVSFNGDDGWGGLAKIGDSRLAVFADGKISLYHNPSGVACTLTDDVVVASGTRYGNDVISGGGPMRNALHYDAVNEQLLLVIGPRILRYSVDPDVGTITYVDTTALSASGTELDSILRDGFLYVLDGSDPNDNRVQVYKVTADRVDIENIFKVDDEFPVVEEGPGVGYALANGVSGITILTRNPGMTVLESVLGATGKYRKQYVASIGEQTRIFSTENGFILTNGSGHIRYYPKTVAPGALEHQTFLNMTLLDKLGLSQIDTFHILGDVNSTDEHVAWTLHLDTPITTTDRVLSNLAITTKWLQG